MSLPVFKIKQLPRSIRSGIIFASNMGCSASVLPSATSSADEDTIRSREEYLENAFAVLSRVRIIPAVQRRRACSVGLPEEEGVFWVYWRAGREGKSAKVAKPFNLPSIESLSSIE